MKQSAVCCDMTAYYNECDAYAAQWLRNLIEAGHIAPGIVDDRSIEDVTPGDLAGFTQVHMFAGVGVWSHALRRAGWSDSRAVWTGSCPCQPFSTAGKSGGFADERHLWPAWFHLISQCRPVCIVGEQVASRDANAWIDLVQTDLEGMGYAVGAVPFPSAGVGAPHIRDRLYWMADAERDGSHRRAVAGSACTGENDWRMLESERRCAARRMGHATGERCGETRDAGARSEERSTDASAALRPGPVNGFWRNADWLYCRDDKWRPVESKPQPLADGSAESLGRVRANIVTEIEEKINATSMENEISGAEILREMRDAIGAKAKQCWTTGRLPQLHEAPFLLAFLRQLTEQRWRFAESCTLPREEIESRDLRMLRDGLQITSPPHQRDMVRQRSEKLANAVHILSSLLARYVETAWADAYRAYAPIGFPLENGAIGRVGRLRGYGNAINAEAATEFIRAYLTCV